MIREQRRDAIERDWFVRREVWSRYAWTEGSKPFWRHGMQVRFRHAFTDGDVTNIPGFDDVADELRHTFPDIIDADYPAESLFAYLHSERLRWPAIEQLYEEAFRMLEQLSVSDAVPF